MEIAQGVSEFKILVYSLANQLNKPRGIEVKGRIAGLSLPEGFTSPSCSESLMSRMCGNDKPPSSVETATVHITTAFNHGNFKREKHRDHNIMMWWDLRIRQRSRWRGYQTVSNTFEWSLAMFM